MNQVTHEEGFKINESKTKVMGKGNRQEVTGLVINDLQAPRVPREVRKKVRAMIHNLKTGKGLQEGTSVNTLIGYIAFINMCDMAEAQQRLEELKGISP